MRRSSRTSRSRCSVSSRRRSRTRASTRERDASRFESGSRTGGGSSRSPTTATASTAAPIPAVTGCATSAPVRPRSGARSGFVRRPEPAPRSRFAFAEHAVLWRGFCTDSNRRSRRMKENCGTSEQVGGESGVLGEWAPARAGEFDAGVRGSAGVLARTEARGKFLWAGQQKLYVKGVTYGAFEPDASGIEYHDRDVIDRDFAHMVESGLNCVRIPHTLPPLGLLDAAQSHGLKVMVGLSAEQYAGYLADPKDAPDVERIVAEKTRAIAGHPAILCYALGNEIPAPLTRWLGARKVERYLERLYEAVKAEDPQGLVTYVNYPTTEYLELPFLDLLAFNVYLEQRDRLEAYLARLHTLAGDRPLLMSEVGLDALRNGEDVQAEVLDWQIRQTFASGCAGAFVFSWTD